MIAQVMAQNSLSSFGFISINKTKETAMEAILLIKEARQALKRAVAEIRHGDEATELSKDPKNQIFVEIAAWHYDQCAAKARQAKTDFGLAQKLMPNGKRREYCRLRAKEAAGFMARAQDAAKNLKNENQ